MELNKGIKKRWSPRVFSEKTISSEMMELMFEAARWAPSARNEQPWQYYYAQRTTKEFDDLSSFLTGNNPDWAQFAQVLIVSVVKKNYDYKNRLNRNALHDLGAANVSLAIQAAEMGLQVHQMAGFDKEKTINYLSLNDELYEPVTIIAAGFPGNEEQLPRNLQIKEVQSRVRKEQNEFVFKL